MKLIKKIAAMALTGIMCLSSSIPAIAATSQDYVPTVDLNSGIAVASDETAVDYTSKENTVTIQIVDTDYNELKELDTSELVSGNMGGVKADATYTDDTGTYNFSHYEYKTSVRNYVASYNSTFEFYVDPPMTILAVYVKSGVTYTKPTGPIVGMYKDPDIKTVDNKALTFFYLCEAAEEGTDLSNVNPSITFGRSALNQSDSDNSETFNVQASNIYSGNYNNNMQFIVASAINNGGPIDIKATATGQAAGAQIKTWDFGTTAFESATSSAEINGLKINGTAGRSTSSESFTFNGIEETFAARLKYNTQTSETANTRYPSFDVSIGDIIRIYWTGNKSGSVMNPINAELKSGSLTYTGTPMVTELKATSTGTFKAYFTGENAYIYCIKVNPYTISTNTDTDVSTETTYINQSFTISPDTESVTIDGQSVSNNGSLSLVQGNTYTVSAPDGYTVSSVNGESGNSFTAATDGATISIVLEEEQTVTATISIDPSDAKISINGTQYSNGESITLTVGSEYRVISTDDAAYTLNSITADGSTITAEDGKCTFTATESSTTITASLTAVTASETTVTQTFTISPSDKTVTINDTTVADGGTLTLDPSTEYTITPPSGYTVSPTSFTTGTGDGTTEITLTADSSSTITSTIWNFNDSVFDGFITTITGSSSATATYNGLTFVSGSSVSADTSTVSSTSYEFADGNKYTIGRAINVNGTSSFTTDRTFSFTATAGQKVRVYYTSASGKYPKFQSTSSGDVVNGTASGGTSTIAYYDFTVTNDGTQYLGSVSGVRFLAIELYSEGPVTTGTINATVKDQNGNALSGATVSCGGITATTDTNGTATLSKVEAGDSLTVSAEYNGDTGTTSNVSLTAGESADVTITITLTTGTITATVKDQNSNAITGAEILFVSDGDGVTWTDNGDGTYTSSSIAAGTYQIYASLDGSESTTADVTVIAGQNIAASITTTRTTGEIQVNLTAADGSPLIDAVVTATDTGKVYSLTEESDGVYIGTVPASTYSISAVYGDVSGTGSIVAENAATTSTDISIALSTVHSVARHKMSEYSNIMLKNDTSAPKWNTESGKWEVNNWHYVNGAVITAMLDMAEATKKTKYSDFAVAIINHVINADGSFTSGSNITNYTATGTSKDRSQLDGVREMTDFQRLYDITSDSRYTTAADYIYNNVLDPITQVTADQDKNAVGSYSHKTTDYPYQIWLDGFFMGFPFYMQYAVNANDTGMITDVYTQYSNLYNIARDPKTGLYYHGYNASDDELAWAAAHDHSESFWLRAMAWLAMAYVDTLEIMPDGDQKDNMKAWFEEYMKAVVEYQDSETGMWKQVVDADINASVTTDAATYTNYFETSGSAGMAAALMKGYRLGYLDLSYYNAGVKAFDGICANKLYYSDTATSDLYAITQANGSSSDKAIDWITPFEITSTNNSGSANTDKYMVLKDICRVAGLGGTSNANNYNETYTRDGSQEYYLKEFRVDNDGKAIAPLMRAYSEVIRHENGSN